MRVSVPFEPLDAVIRAHSTMVLVLSQGAYGNADHLPTSAPAPMLLTTGAASYLNVATYSRSSFIHPPWYPPD
jgi:hypothetical protein